MPKKRNPENKGLPTGWRQRSGRKGYYYDVPKGCEAQWDGKRLFKLGETLPEAYTVWAERVNRQSSASTIGDLLDMYMIRVVPQKAIRTQKGNKGHCKVLRLVFGEMSIHSLLPVHVYQYYEKREAKFAAKREIALLSHAFTKAIEWGLVERHPFKGQVRLPGEKARERYVEDWEILEVFSLSPSHDKDPISYVKSYIEIKLLTGLRQTDMLKLNLHDHIKEEGIELRTNKNNKWVLIKWTPLLREAVERAKTMRPVDISPYLFCTRRGECYYNEETGSSSGWESLWQRVMKRALKETKLEQKFQEKDIRAKVGSDQENDEKAARILTHSNTSITEKHYRRKAQSVTPSDKTLNRPNGTESSRQDN
jgi:hypothetical protein